MPQHHTPAAFPTASSEFQSASGPIDYQMTNDYMFHAVLQKNPKVLKSLICSLLDLHPDDIRSIQILNPINLGASIDNKTFILDINILFNNNTLINLEMQVKNLPNWEDRSLSYLCRAFDQLQKGMDYAAAKPAVHISILNFTPFPDLPEFYASYKLLNEKNHQIYSDKFSLRMLDLTCIHLATPHDLACRLDCWARLFKAATWEEIKMIAEHNADLLEASETLYTLNADYMIRKQCEARADYYKLHNTIDQKLNTLSAENQCLSAKVENLSSKNQCLTSKNQCLTSENLSLNSKVKNLTHENQEKDLLIQQLMAQLHKNQPPV